jgi:hypothetical protein
MISETPPHVVPLVYKAPHRPLSICIDRRRFSRQLVNYNPATTVAARLDFDCTWINSSRIRAMSAVPITCGRRRLVRELSTQEPPSPTFAHVCRGALHYSRRVHGLSGLQPIGRQAELSRHRRRPGAGARASSSASACHCCFGTLRPVLRHRALVLRARYQPKIEAYERTTCHS